jgi:hypothetical protein
MLPPSQLECVEPRKVRAVYCQTEIVTPTAWARCATNNVEGGAAMFAAPVDEEHSLSGGSVHVTS